MNHITSGGAAFRLPSLGSLLRAPAALARRLLARRGGGDHATSDLVGSVLLRVARQLPPAGEGRGWSIRLDYSRHPEVRLVLMLEHGALVRPVVDVVMLAHAGGIDNAYEAREITRFILGAARESVRDEKGE